MPGRHKEQHRLESTSLAGCVPLPCCGSSISAHRSWKRCTHGRGRPGCWGYVDGDGGIRIGFLAGGH